MANENDIKSRIVLDGEKEYRDALKSANRELKTLRSELKAETAELGANATAQQKNEVRMKSLQKQIKEQAKIVDTYKKALDEVKEKYSDNEDEIAKWEQKLNGARATLANMQNELEGVDKTFKEMQTDAGMATVATKSVADSLGSIAAVGGTVSDAIEGIFTGMLDFVKETITDIWADIVDLAARSNGLVDLAGFWNTDVTTIQKYKGAVESVSGTLEDLNSIVTKINAGDSKKIAELTGVSAEMYQDQWQYAMAVMSAMSKMNTQTRNNAAFDIFGGRQATKAFDLLNDWEKLLSELDTFDVEKNGFGLTDEQLHNASDYYDMINKLQASWQSLKDMMTWGIFGQIAIDMTSNAQGVLEGFLSYMNAETPEERDEAIKTVSENILGMFRTVQKAIEDGIGLIDQIAEEFKGSEDPTVKVIGELMGGLADALEWFTKKENMETVLWGLGALAAFWVTGEGLKLAATVAELAANIKTISLFKMLGGIAGGGMGSMGETIGTTAGSSFLSTIKAGLPAVLAGALIAAGFEWAADRRKNHPEEVRGTEEYLEKQSGDDSNLLLNYILAQRELDSLDVVTADAERVEELTKRVSDAYAALLASENGEAALKAYSDWRQERSYGNMDWVLPDYIEEEETVSLDEKSAEEIAEAIQDWWDAQRNADNDLDDYEEAWRALDWMQEVLGDEFGDIYENIMRHLDEMDREQQLTMEDLPASWWMHGSESGEGITNENLTAFNSLPGKMEKAVAKAVGGIRVYLDGQAVGNLVTPYVSQNIALDIG